MMIYNVLGQRVAQLSLPAVPGPGTVTWDGRDEAGWKLASGLYFYRLEASGLVETKKLMILR